MVQDVLNKQTLDAPPPVADVVIIGAGPAGAAAAWAIERAAPGTRTVLLEQGAQPGAGSSTASLENYRTCWPALCLARQMARSVQIFHQADDYLGAGAADALHLKQRGYLFCGFTPAQADALRQDVAHLHSIGLTHIEYLAADEVRYRFPWLGERVIAAKFDPVAGWLDSNALVSRFIRSARTAKIVFQVQDIHLLVKNHHIIGVQTAQGTIHAPQVLIASGASARQLGRTAGVELPLVMRPRQSVTVANRHVQFPEDAPMLIGAAPHPHVRPEARNGAIFGWEYTWYTKQIDHRHEHGRDYLIDPVQPIQSLKDPRFPSMVTTLLARQFGHGAGQGFNDPCYTRNLYHNIGYYVSRSGAVAYKTLADGTIQPYESERAILDAVAEVNGLFVSVAHVGHGIMTSPAAGEIIAAKMLGRDLPDPVFHQFGMDVPCVAHDEAVL
ncbi:MAG: FAD-binding oxidoreductase [Anaerolineae bacterium]|jgi:glycine/D-amino acid oxidase-like deaminating enzyme|nr:FAD-binding oxidoreductase [Anaerolineae bacterium]